MSQDNIATLLEMPDNLKAWLNGRGPMPPIAELRGWLERLIERMTKPSTL